MRLLIGSFGRAERISAVVIGGIVAVASWRQAAAGRIDEAAGEQAVRGPGSADWLNPSIATLVGGIKIADNVYSGRLEPQLRTLISAVVTAASNGADYVLMFRDYHHAWEGNGLVRLDQGPNLFWVPVQSTWDNLRTNQHGTAHAPAAEVERVWSVIDEELDASLTGAFYSDDCEEANHGTFTFFLVRRSGRVSVYVWRECRGFMPFRLPKMMFELLREDQPWIQASKDRPAAKYRRPSFED